MKKASIGFFFTLPLIVVISAIVLYPLLRIFVLSFFRVTIFATNLKFYGFRNYTYLLHYDRFWNSLSKTLVWTASGVTLQVIVGLGVALVVHKKFPGRNILRAAVFFPYLVPIVMAAMTWFFLFNHLYGVVNYLLISIGIITRPITWWASPRHAMMGVVVIGLWKYSPFCVINLLAGLQTIPEELYEVAQIDGASKFRQFFCITIPSIMPVLIMVVLLRSIWVFNDFNLIHLVTKGGPLDATRTLPIFIYEEAFGQYNLGLAGAGGILMLMVLTLLMVGYVRLYGRSGKWR